VVRLTAAKTAPKEPFPSIKRCPAIPVAGHRPFNGAWQGKARERQPTGLWVDLKVKSNIRHLIAGLMAPARSRPMG
jgi:hypothetical protein